MSGTWASYQGHPCSSVSFVRARGSASSTTQVVIPAQNFPAAFDWKEANEELKRRPLAEIPTGLEAGLSGAAHAGVLQLTAGLNYEGTLVLAENVSAPVVIPGLVVLRVEVDQVDDTGGVAFIRLTLADERVFSPLGVLDRWRWNTLRKDGSKSKDTLKADETLFTLTEIAGDVVRGMWRKPALNRAPDRWDGIRRSVSLREFPGAWDSLEEIATLNQAEVSYHLDAEVAVYDQGEGMVGYAPGGKGPNRIPFPASVILDEDGAGLGHTMEANWPAEYMLVVGRERIATVALDNWEPVLLVDGLPFLLSEELIRLLTGGSKSEDPIPGVPGAFVTKVSGGTYGLKWLKKWVQIAGANQGASEVSEDVTTLLAAQAWKYWRMPGVEKHQDGFYTGELGRNAHLLPMLDRAETRAGRRIRPTVFAASWETKQGTLAARAAFSGLGSAQKKIAAIKEAVKLAFISKGDEFLNPLEQGNPTVTEGTSPFPAALRQGQALTLDAMNGGKPVPPGTDTNRLNSAMREYRRIAKLRELGMEELASQYESALGEKIKAQDELGYEDLSSTYAAAKQLTDWEREAFEEGDNPAGRFKDQFGERAQELLVATGNKRRQARRQGIAQQEAGTPRGKVLSYVFLQNNRRAPDGSARVESDDLGVVRTSKRAGHVDNEDRNDPSLTHFVPKPVRVLFGAVVRPRVDVPPEVALERSEGATGGAGAEAELSLFQQFTNALTGDPGFGDFVPAALGDKASTYAAAFQRTGPGKVRRVDLDQVPLDRVQPIRRLFQELVPISERGNRSELDAESEKLAIGVSSPPSRTSSSTYLLAGPWPVQCDGLVSSVQIRSESVNGAICGFTTTVSVGGEATVRPTTGTTGNRRPSTVKQ